jgi:hypothetical protein
MISKLIRIFKLQPSTYRTVVFFSEMKKPTAKYEVVLIQIS